MRIFDLQYKQLEVKYAQNALENFVQLLGYSITIDEFAKSLDIFKWKMKTKNRKSEFSHLIKPFDELYNLDNQTVGNCQYANIEGMFYSSLLRINDFFVNPEQHELTPERVKTLKDLTKQQYEDFKIYVRQTSMLELLDEPDRKKMEVEKKTLPEILTGKSSKRPTPDNSPDFKMTAQAC